MKFMLSTWHTELYFHCFETPKGWARNNGFPQLINWRLSVSKLVTVTCFFVVFFVCLVLFFFLSDWQQ